MYEILDQDIPPYSELDCLSINAFELNRHLNSRIDVSEITWSQSAPKTVSALHSAEQMQGAGRVGVNPVVLCSTQNAIAGCTLKAYYFFDK